MKDILVHVDRQPGTPARLTTAVMLARQTGARLTGLFGQQETDGMSAAARKPSGHFLQAAAEAKAMFDAAVADSGLATQWYQLPHGEPDFVIAEIGFCARFFDLLIMGQTDTPESPCPPELAEQVVLNAGRPVMVIPQYGGFSTIGKRIVLAWNASREATRAAHDALPLLRAAESVTVLSIRSGDGAHHELPNVDIVDHLRQQGVKAEGERLPDEMIGKTEMLLSRACDHGADLLVMGAYGHYGLSRLRGSATRHMLKHMTLPVLLSK